MMRLRGPKVIALLVVHACAEEGLADDPRATYHRDVAPILNEHCASCHVEGGLAPFAVAQYESAATWAELIVATTQARTMPPLSNPTPLHPVLRNPRSSIHAHVRCPPPHYLDAHDHRPAQRASRANAPRGPTSAPPRIPR